MAKVSALRVLAPESKEQPPYDCLTAPPRVAVSEDGPALLATDPTALPMAVTLALNFPAETLELVLNVLGAKWAAGEIHEGRGGFPSPVERRAFR